MIIILLIFGLTISLFAAWEFENIAKMKGHPEKKYFWWCFLVGFVGYSMVIALPDRSAQKTAAAERTKISEAELPEI